MKLPPEGKHRLFKSTDKEDKAQEVQKATCPLPKVKNEYIASSQESLLSELHSSVYRAPITKFSKSSDMLGQAFP